jgi:phosphoglycerol transferase MdoB-like AlkP superfamily enzyme
MKKIFRLQEYSVLLYRILLVYIFYFISRVLFFIYNKDVLKVDSFFDFLSLSYRGLAFDTTSIVYINSLFIFLSVLPLFVNSSKKFQSRLTVLYFVTNLIAYASNFVDFIYYKFIYSRTTIAVLDTLEHETNKGNMFFRFMISYWHVYALFILLAGLWYYLYKKVKVVEVEGIGKKVKYVSYSILGFLFVVFLCIGGIRGDYKKSTRPLSMIDANRHVKKVQHGDIVLNTPFSIIRTLGKDSFKKVDYVEESLVEKFIEPIKTYNNNPKSKPNIVIIITESMGREYIGAFNKNVNIPNYVSYTPFLDSLAQHSKVFVNAHANGSKSIHGMSSVLSGIPSFKDAFTSSPYSNQKIQSLVSCLKELDYDTSFFHGAPNGSMGFLGFGNILGFDHYYGKTEYNNDKDFDGSWGIWDEPFLQYMKKELDKKTKPFMATVFTITSHEPFVVPEKYKGKFPKGNIPMHECVGYTDYAFKRFFEEAKKEAWFNNTIFILTADHCNQVYYGDEYYKVVNRQAVPILIYKPNSSLKGENTDFAQQIDIYPTVLDLIGYNKPFRSLGRSLVSENGVKPFAINFNGAHYQLQRGNYIYTFDGKETAGIYKKEDLGLLNNLKASVWNKEMKENEIVCKAFLQSYFNSIVDRKLNN